MVARGQDMGPRYGSKADVHFSVIPREDRSRNVLIMFEPQAGDGSAAARKAAKSKKH